VTTPAFLLLAYFLFSHINTTLAPVDFLFFIQELEYVQTTGYNTRSHLGTVIKCELLQSEVLLQLVQQKRLSEPGRSYKPTAIVLLFNAANVSEIVV
jgi:hypothetical protein